MNTDDVAGKDDFAGRLGMFESPVEALLYAMEEENQEYFDYLLEEEGTQEPPLDLFAKHNGNTLLHEAAKKAARNVHY